MIASTARRLGRRRLRSITLITLAALTGCERDPAGVDPAARGIWVSDGYGYLIEIRGGTLEAAEVTAVSCLPIGSFRLERARGDTAVYATDGIRLSLWRGAGDAERLMAIEGSVAHMVFRRVSERPAACRTAPSNTPEANFDIFVRTYAEHYPFFRQRGVDWDALARAARPRIGTTPEQMFEALRTLIEPLHDGHTQLYYPQRGLAYAGSRPDPHPIGEAELRRAGQILATRLSAPREFAGGAIVYGRLADSIAYLGINGFAGYSESGPAEHDRIMGDALERIFAEAGGWRGLVVDVRGNPGGFDFLGLRVAGRLTETAYVAYTKEARNDPADPARTTRPVPVEVRPATGPRYRGAVVLLTSRFSGSAAETFAMALMGRRPEVSRIGENTQGIFSDVLNRSLPNGITFGLPNEIYRTPSGQSFDIVGVPPHVHVAVFTPEELDGGRDSALDAAISALSR